MWPRFSRYTGVHMTVGPDPHHIHWSTQVGAGAWIAPGLHPTLAGDVGVIIPEGFAAYCRVLHPASRTVDGTTVSVPWAEVARWTGGTMHPLVQFPHLSKARGNPEMPPWDEDPPEGTLPQGTLAALVEDLRQYTRTPDHCWFAVWDGRGSLYTTVPLVPSGSAPVALPGSLPREVRDGPRLHTPLRDYVLYTGSIEAAAALGTAPGGEGPNLWWPEDRAWCVSTEIDLPWTFVGGSEALVEELCRDGRLEAFPVKITDPIWIDSDTING